MPWQDGTPRRARQRARAALRANPFRSDAVIARQARVSSTTAAAARHQLEQAGLIPAVPVSRRERQPYPRQQSATHDAIIGGARTAREVADAAGVSLQAAWKALRAHRDREDIPKPLPPAAECERCGRAYVPAPRPGGRPQRYCSDRCADRGYKAERRAERGSGPVAPQAREIPPMPWRIAEAGLCADPRTVARTGYVWTSSDPASRRLARAVCKSCPAQIPCMEWSVIAVPATDNAIYAGAGRFTRNRIRRSRRRPAAVPAQPGDTRGTVPPERVPAPGRLAAAPGYGHIGGRPQAAASIVAAGRPGA